MSYLLMVTNGTRKPYVWKHEISSLLRAEALARGQAQFLNDNKLSKVFKVTVLRKVGEYDGKS